MATTFKTLLNSDIANTRTLLHEAIPITGTIVSGTYTDLNIKTFAHGMYESVFDYPFLSSSANHIFDITAGYAADSTLSASSNVQGAKKINIYNQHAQVLYGYDVNGNIQNFDRDGNIAGGGDKMKECFFLNFSRLLTKDEIKKDSFRLSMFASSSAVKGIVDGGAALTTGVRNQLEVIGDYGATTSYKVNSPAGEYGLLYSSSATPRDTNGNPPIGHIYYQAGIAVITASFFSGAFGDPSNAADRTQSTGELGVQASKTNAITFADNPADGQSFTITMPVGSGQDGGKTITIKFLSTMTDPSDANTIHILQTGGTGATRNNVVNAINGFSNDANIRYGSNIAGGTTSGINGLEADPGTSGAQISLQASVGGTVGNGITLTDVDTGDTFLSPLAGGSGEVAVMNRLTGSTITQLANGLRYNFSNVEFNNTTELNSTIYFCRANTQDYNYSANPTYLNASKIRVKNDNPKAQPVAYITTVGLYGSDNELLAVAKLSEPLKKSPSNEITLRVRLDY